MRRTVPVRARTWPVRRRRGLGALALLAFLAACGGAGASPGGEDPPAPPGEPADCAPAPCFADGKTPVSEIHVALGGSDDTGNGSVGAPFATPARALRDAEPGAAIRVHAGTYDGGLGVTDVHGSEDAPIWLGGMPGESTPVIQGGTEGLHLTRVRHVVLHDLVVRSATHNGINCDDGGATDDPLATHHVLFERLDVHDIGTGGNHDGLKLSGLRDYVVRECVFRRVNAGSGIDHVGCHRGRILACRFEDMGSNAIQLKGGTADVEIRGCTFERAGQRGINIGGSTGFEYFRPPLSTTTPNAEARDVRVVANVFGDAYTPFAFVGAVDCLVANNTFRSASYHWLFRVLQETTTSGDYVFLETRDCRLQNNLFHFRVDGLSTYVNVGSNTRGDTYTISNNLWFTTGDAGRSRPTNLPAAETDGVYGEDPFPAPAVPPRIPGGSPAVGAGTPIDAVTGDAEGTCYADPPAIGAFAAP